MTNTITSLSVAQLQHVIRLKEEIEALEKQLAALIGGAGVTSTASAGTVAKPQKRFVSAATRAKMSAAHQARLAKLRPAVTAPAAKTAKSGKMSAAGRAAIIAAQKARWAKIKAAKALPVANSASKVPAAASKPAPKTALKRKISPEGIARIVAATKARWARVNAAKAVAKKR